MTRRRSIAFLTLMTAGISTLYAAHGCVSTVGFVGALPTPTSWWSVAWQSLWPWPPWILGAPIVAWLAVRWSIVQRGPVRFLGAHATGAVLLMLFLSLVYQPWALGLLVSSKPKEVPASTYFEQYGEDTPDADEPAEQVTYVPSTDLAVLLWHLLYFSLLAAINQGLLAFIEMGRQRAQNAELHAAADRARLSALQKQLNPHFLFNVLNSICYIATREPHAARAMLLRLSTMLRSSFDTGEIERPLTTEIELTRAYIELCRLRYGDRLCVDWNISPDLNGERVPSWSLQTLVENAVVHAVEKTAAPVHVEINIGRGAEELTIEITDDGPGCAAETGGYREGVGLGNLRQRMRHLYGDRGTFRIEPGGDGGFRVALTVPQSGGHSPSEADPP
jgi:hypothetical protein